MVQEANPLRPIMVLNLGEPILGGVYELYVDALGVTVAWWIGHITIVSIFALMYWTITNWSAVANGLGITGARFSAWLALLTLIGGQFILYRNQFGFPPIGAFLTAVSTSLYLWWQWYQLEPQKA
jgi:hypothetical protein